MALLELHGVGKDYARVVAGGSRVRLVLDLLRGRAPQSMFTALDSVTLTVEPGASLGVIGENGAGKSTLLKIVAGVVKPTRGSVRVHGRIAALLELGSGFHPEYTGYANIDLAAALLGISPDEIAGKRETIVEFADIGEHIHDPIKTYSSGMVVRLGFAIATVLQPDVLITDEVFAVGDESFQKKCITWMENYLSGGGTLLLCSHSMYHVQKLCSKALWLDHGKVRSYDEAGLVAREYLAWHEQKMAKHGEQARSQGGEYLIKRFDIAAVYDARGEIDASTGFGVDLEVSSPDGRTPVVAVGVIRADGTPVYGTTSEVDGIVPERIGPDRFRFHARFHSLPLLPGHYLVRAHAVDPEGMRVFDHHERPIVLAGQTRELGYCRLPHDWSSGARRDAA